MRRVQTAQENLAPEWIGVRPEVFANPSTETNRFTTPTSGVNI